jgi:hypothetical protein
MTRAVAHIRKLWGHLWLLPALPLVYAVVVWTVGDLRPEHVVFAVVCLALGYASPATKRFLVDVSPYVAVGIAYDLVRYARRALLTPDRVIGCELRSLELSLFAVAPDTTPQDWFMAHHAPFFDLLFSVPYAIFAYVALLYAGYLYFVDRPRMRHYLWAFAIANGISFVTWLALPAAPPWYVREHGCFIDMSVQPSPAALTRVDALLGIDYFAVFYSRAASVFGALPSMHCAYPLLGLLTARQSATWRTWPLHVGYTVLMFVASVYLDHHWVIDGLLGWAIALAAVWIAGVLLRRRSVPASLGATNNGGPEAASQPVA